MKGKGKKKVWVGWTWRAWDKTSGWSGWDFIMCDIQKERIEKDMKRIKITVEEL